MPNAILLNVNDFGATGDGVTDDTLAIQAALGQVTALFPVIYNIYFPKGTYVCNLTSSASFPQEYSAQCVFNLPNAYVYFSGDGIDVSTIITSQPASLFYGYPSLHTQTSQTLYFQNLTLSCTTGWIQTAYSFGILFSGASLTCNNVKFLDWTQAIRVPEYMDPQSGSLLCYQCQFLSTHGEAGIANHDPAYLYPTTSILSGAVTTSLQNCTFNGCLDTTFTGVPGGVPLNRRYPVDGIIKTNNQIKSLTVNGCQTFNNANEAIACDGQSAPTPSLNLSIIGNYFTGPPALPGFRAGGCCACSMTNSSGIVTANTMLNLPQAFHFYPGPKFGPPNTASTAGNTLINTDFSF